MPLPLPSAPFHFQLDVRVAALRRLRWAGGCCRGPPAPSTGQCAGASEKKQCTSPGPWAPWGGGRRRGEGCPPRPASAGFLGERRSHRSLPDPHRLLQPACAWTPCWWPRTEPCSSAQPPPTVCTRVALRSCALPRTPKAGKRTQNRGFSPLGTYDSFFLAPEVAEQEVVTEKASGRPRPSLPPSGRPRPSSPRQRAPLALPTPQHHGTPSAQSRGWGGGAGPAQGPGEAGPSRSAAVTSRAWLSRPGWPPPSQCLPRGDRCMALGASPQDGWDLGRDRSGQTCWLREPRAEWSAVFTRHLPHRAIIQN